MTRIISAILLLTFAASVNAGTIYNVNRTIGAGTVIGTLETDGTLGILQSQNITDYSLTLTAPNLLGGSPDLITFATGLQLVVQGNGLQASLAALTFDFSQPGVFLLQGGSQSNYWCLDGTNSNCAGTPDSTEIMGRSATTGLAAQFVSRTGQVVIANAPVVPLPAAAWLFISAIGGLVVAKRRQLNA